MANPPIMDRLTDAIQREHELIMELRELGNEFLDSIERMQVMASRLQVGFERTNVVQLPQAQDDNFTIPNALKSGPNRRTD